MMMYQKLKDICADDKLIFDQINIFINFLQNINRDQIQKLKFGWIFEDFIFFAQSVNI